MKSLRIERESLAVATLARAWISRRLVTAATAYCGALLMAMAGASHAQETTAVQSVSMIYSVANGLGPQDGMMRRDPSDIIQVDDLYYVWYSKGTQSHGYDATVWYATSPEPSHKNPNNFVRNGEPVGELQGYSAPLVAAEATRWLSQVRDKTKPFALSVWFHALATGNWSGTIL